MGGGRRSRSRCARRALHIGVRVTCVEPGFVDTELQGHNEHPIVVEQIEKMREAIGKVLEADGHRQRDRLRGLAAQAREHQRDARPPVGPDALSALERVSAGQTFVRDNVRLVSVGASERADGAPTDRLADVGARVRALREAMGLSLRDLAERSGVSAPMLSQVERGETSPTLAVAARIAAGLDLSLSQLLRLDEDGHVVVVRRGQGRKRRRGGHASRS